MPKYTLELKDKKKPLKNYRYISNINPGIIFVTYNLQPDFIFELTK